MNTTSLAYKRIVPEAHWNPINVPTNAGYYWAVL